MMRDHQRHQLHELLALRSGQRFQDARLGAYDRRRDALNKDRLNINLRAIGKQHSLLATRHQSSDKHAIALRPDTRQPLTHSAKPRASKFQYPACIPALQTTLTRTQADANGDQDGFVFGRGHRLRCSYGLVVFAQHAAQVAFNLSLNLETAVDP